MRAADLPGSGRERPLARPLGLVTAALVSLRPRQWVKNLFVFAAVVFSRNLFTPLVWSALGAFVIFCGLSGAVYLINDVADMDKDRRHPLKRLRPIASGALPRGAAAVLGGLLVAASLTAAFALAPSFGLVATGYAVLLIAYSFWLKYLVIVDVLTVAIGFVLRAIAGAEAVDVEISGWLVICTVLIALFLALGKRRHEYLSLEGDAAAHRPILAEYSEGFLDQMIAVVTASTAMAYALYTMWPETVSKFHTRLLPLTFPFVLYGIFRYLYLLYHLDLGGNPSDLLLSDRALLLNTLFWMATLLAIIYGPVWGLWPSG
jgi:4-hydroxybenzoate polyprenyltransferase